MQTKSSLLHWLIMVALGILGGLIIWPFDPLRVGTGLSFLVSLPIFAYVYGVICRHQEDRQKALKQYSEFLLVGNLIVLALHASVGLPFLRGVQVSGLIRFGLTMGEKSWFACPSMR